MSDTKNPPIIPNLKNLNLPHIKRNYTKKVIPKTVKKSPDTSSKIKKSNINKIIVVNKNSNLTTLNGRNQSKHLACGGTYKKSSKVSKKINTGLDLSQRSSNTQKKEYESHSLIDNISETIIKDQKIIKNNQTKKTHTEKKELIKPRIKIKKYLLNKDKDKDKSLTHSSLNNTVNENKNQENISKSHENITEKNRTLHSFIISNDANIENLDNTPKNPSNSNTQTVTSHTNANGNNETTKINTDNTSDIFIKVQKDSKETIETVSIANEIIDNKNIENKNDSMNNSTANGMHKYNKGGSLPNLKKKNENSNKKNHILNIKMKIVNKDNNLYSDYSPLHYNNPKSNSGGSTIKNKNISSRTNKFLLTNKKNYARANYSCHSTHNASNEYNNKNINYNYLKSIDKPITNLRINKNNSVGCLNSVIKKSNLRLDDSKSMNSSKVNKIKINNLKNKKIENYKTMTNMNKIKKCLYDNINNYNDHNQNSLITPDNKKKLNKSIIIPYKSNNFNNNSTTLQKTHKTLKKITKPKLDTTKHKKNPKKKLIKTNISPNNNISNNNKIEKNNIENNNISNNIKDQKSPKKKENEEYSIEKELEKSPLSVSNKSTNFIPKEYPNMAKQEETSKKNSKKEYSFIKEEKTIKNIYSLCKRGYSGPGVKKLNQDNYFIYKKFLQNDNFIYMGICDGHGIFGQNVSDFLVENLPNNLNQKFLSQNIYSLKSENIYDLSTIFEQTFIETNKQLNENERIDCSLSGSTCVSLIYTPERLICINVGDSRCILGKFVESEWLPMNLSRDHKPGDPDEKLRIEKRGGVVEAFKDVVGGYIGPERVWVKGEDSPGLAMSRSFGDEVAHKVGVIVNPEIFDYHLLSEDKFVVIASDGIWEFMSSDEVVNVVKDFYLKDDIEGAVNFLYKEASNRWITKEDIIDDITIIVVFFN